MRIAPQAYRGRALLDSLKRILDLVQATLRREDGVAGRVRSISSCHRWMPRSERTEGGSLGVVLCGMRIGDLEGSAWRPQRARWHRRVRCCETWRTGGLAADLGQSARRSPFVSADD